MSWYVTLNLTFNTGCIKDGGKQTGSNQQTDNNKDNMAARSGIQATLKALSLKFDTKVILINHNVTPYTQYSVTLSSAFV